MTELYDSLDFGILLIDDEERISLCNRWLRQRARWLNGEPCGQLLAQALAIEPSSRLLSAIAQSLQRGHSSRLSSALHPTPLPLYDRPDDTQRIRHAVDIISVPAGSERRQCLLQVRDMTESYRREDLLKRQARQLQLSERRLTATLENAPIGMALSTLEGRWTYVNRALCDILGTTAEELLQRDSLDIVAPQDRHRHRPFEQGLRNHHVRDFQIEERWVHHSGQAVWVRLTATRVDDDVSEPYMILQIEPISDRKRKEQEIANALAEKETLLREVYHRVKNNLQVIQSLLNLKRSSVSDVAARNALAETAHRVRAMALVHEKLYQSSQLSAIDLGEYLHELLAQLQEALGSSARGIRVTVHTTEVPADLNVAIPFGLIVTELVTNSLKHAFPDDRGGDLRVSLISSADGALLAVEDNGVGYPKPSAQSSRGSLGLKLVESLTRQLDGELQVHHGQGVRFELRLQNLAKRTSQPD